MSLSSSEVPLCVSMKSMRPLEPLEGEKKWQDSKKKKFNSRDSFYQPKIFCFLLRLTVENI
jgi:hypothetical protein